MKLEWLVKWPTGAPNTYRTYEDLAHLRKRAVEWGIPDEVHERTMADKGDWIEISPQWLLKYGEEERRYDS